MPGLSGVIETQFIRPLFSGENLYPFRVGKPKLAVIPCDKTSLLDQEAIDIYNTSGMHICCAKLRDKKAIVNSDLYWAPAQSEAEADFISAILNAPVTTELARPLMSYGKDERHIHKHVWELPIEQFDHSNDIHKRIVVLGAKLEKLASTFKIDEALHFAATRRHIRDFTMSTPEGVELNDLVANMLE